MSRFGIAASAVTKILITHFHGDHCLGLPGVIQRLSMDRVSQTVDIYYPASGQKYFERLSNASVFYKQVHLNANPITDEGVIFEDKNLSIYTCPLDHTIESWGYRIEEKDSTTLLPDKLKEMGVKGPDIGKLKNFGVIEINGRRITVQQVGLPKKGQSFAFVMDTRLCENISKLSKNADLMVCEATYLSDDRRLAEEYGHLTVVQAANIARDCQVGRLVLSHFSQRYIDTKEFIKEAGEIFPDVIAAEDGDSFTFPKQRVSTKPE